MSDLTTKQLNKMREEAKKLHKLGLSLASHVRQDPMKLARQVLLPVDQKELYKYMETTYSSFDDFRQDLGLGRSTAFDWKKIAAELQDISDDDFYGMTMANARLLAKLAPKQRTAAMINRAKTMNEEDFLAAVNKVKKDNGEMTLDERVTFKVRLYQAQKEIIEEAMKQYAEHHNIESDNEGRILELMSAEIIASLGNGKSIIGGISAAMQRAAFELGQANYLFDPKSELSADETLKKLKETILGVAQTLATASKGFAFTGEETPGRPVPVETKAKSAAAGVQ